MPNQQNIYNKNTLIPKEQCEKISWRIGESKLIALRVTRMVAQL